MTFLGNVAWLTALGAVGTVGTVWTVVSWTNRRFPLRVGVRRKLWELGGSCYFLAHIIVNTADPRGLRDLQLAWVAYHHAYRVFNSDPHYLGPQIVWTFLRSVVFHMCSPSSVYFLPALLSDHLINIYLHS